MSRSRKDKKGGHPWPGYNKENWVIKQLTRRKRRRANKRYAQDPENESLEPNPEKSTGGWLTW